jgi:hypothetical protein
MYLIVIFFFFSHVAADNGVKSLRQIHDEKEDEERFQLDLKRAVQQSLGNFVQSTWCHGLYMFKIKCCIVFSESSVLISYSDTIIERDPQNGTSEVASTALDANTVGPGLKNAVGEYNCFLNVIIQVLDRLGSKLASFIFSICVWIKQNIGYFLGDQLVQGIHINHLYPFFASHYGILSGLERSF